MEHKMIKVLCELINVRSFYYILHSYKKMPVQSKVCCLSSLFKWRDIPKCIILNLSFNSNLIFNVRSCLLPPPVSGAVVISRQAFRAKYKTVTIATVILYRTQECPGSERSVQHYQKCTSCAAH